MLNIYDYNGPNGPEGAGANGPPMDYGVWGVPVDHEFTVRNDGGGPATMVGNGGTMGTGFSLEGRQLPGHRRRLRRHAGGERDLQAGGHVHAERRATLFGQVRVAYSDGVATRTAIRAVSGHADLARARDGGRVLRPEQLQQLHAVRLRQRRDRHFTRARVHRLQHRRACRASLTPAAGLNAPSDTRRRAAIPATGHLRIDARRRHVVPAGRRVRAADRAAIANSTINLGYDDTFASPKSASRAITGSGL